MSPITEVAGGASPTGAGAGEDDCAGSVVGAIEPPIICTVRYTRTCRARRSATAMHADITGDSKPPVSKPPPVKAGAIPSARAASTQGVSPMVAIPSTSDASIPASAIAARDDSTVSSSPPMPVRRPILEMPMPEMIDWRSGGSLRMGLWSRGMDRHIQATAPRILPEITPHNRAFWTGGRNGVLLIQRCAACRRWVHPPTDACPACGGALTAEPASGTGSVLTFTVNEQQFHPDVSPPYVIALVTLDEQDDLRIPANLVRCDAETLECGMRVRVLFEPHGEVFVPVFEPDRPTSA